nr:glycosyltransferase family 4 protein [Lewinella sp. JB7]
MRDHGFRVVSVAGDDRMAPGQTFSWPHFEAPLTRRMTPWQDVRAIIQLITLMRQLRPDIVHTHTPKAGLLGMLAARFTGVPIRIHTLGGLPLVTARGSRRVLLWLAEKVTGYAAQHIWANGPTLLDDVRRMGLYPKNKLEMVADGSSNGIDLRYFSSLSVSDHRISAARKAFSYSPAASYLLYVGRLVHDKGIDELVSSFAQLVKKRPQLKLLLIGPLEEERDEEKLLPTTRRIIESNPAIVHLHWTDDVPAFMYAADLLVFPSHREGFPNVLLQAGAMELPIVCSDVPGNIDIVDHRSTGLVFPARNGPALLDAIENALTHPEQMKRMAVKLRQIIENKFDRNHIHAELLRRYRSLLFKADSCSTLS